MCGCDTLKQATSFVWERVGVTLKTEYTLRVGTCGCDTLKRGTSCVWERVGVTL